MGVLTISPPTFTGGENPIFFAMPGPRRAEVAGGRKVRGKSSLRRTDDRHNGRGGQGAAISRQGSPSQRLGD